LRWVNVLLCGAIALCATLWWSELSWAARELPRYLQGRIGGPAERRLSVQGKRLIQAGGDLDTARGLLQRSIAIDPHSDAVYWLGECLLATGDADGALERFQQYIEFDPTRASAYLQAAHILRDRGHPERAHALLERGLRYFVSHRAKLQPRPDPEVSMKFNRKALEVHAYYGESIARLEAELRGVETRGDAP
jgi:tetratricopeptide (TPR) repeat protein